MGDLVYPIAYLEKSDFSESGDLLGSFNDKPAFIMIQGSYCNACNLVKPIFQQLANEGIIQCLTIQLDGERQSEKDVANIIDTIYSGLAGIPAFIMYSNKHRILYEGGRNFEEMNRFIQKFT